jgi:hypothetical protein
VYIFALLDDVDWRKTFSGKNTAFDVILENISSSVVSHAATRSSKFFLPALGAGLLPRCTLMGLENGRIQRNALRSQVNNASLEEVKEARLERSGDISVIKNG